MLREIHLMGEEEILYHGSGANFDCFDARYLSTGLGGQSQGWGFYFSTNKDFAKNVTGAVKNKTRRSKIGKFDINDFVIRHDNPVFDKLPLRIKSVKEMREYIIDTIDYLEEVHYDPDTIKDYKDALLVLDKEFGEEDEKVENSLIKYVYTVLAFKGKTPEEYDFLDYTGSIRPDQIDRINTRAVSEKLTSFPKINPKMQSQLVYMALQKYFGNNPEKTSMFLVRCGIDGVRSGDTRVIFDPKSLEIIDKCEIQ